MAKPNYVPYDAEWEVDMVPKKASTVLVAGDLVAPDGSGACEPADENDTEVYGIGLKDVVSTDDDYADNTLYPVLVPKRKSAKMIAQVGNGTIASTDVDSEFDLAADGQVDAAASSKDIVQLVRAISTTEGVFIINKPVRI